MPLEGWCSRAIVIYFGNGVIKTQETFRETEAEGDQDKLDEPLQRLGCSHNGKKLC